MSRILAIDPGPEQSAWLTFADGAPVEFGIEPNVGVRVVAKVWGGPGHEGLATVVIEQVESFGMAVGREVFETVRWAGRFEEAAQPLPVILVPRRTVKLHLCGSAKAKDANIRQALIDRFGGPTAIRKGGALYGVSKDVWSALALAVTYADGAAA